MHLNGVLMDKLSKIRVIPVAFESLGVRSMCTYVETPDIKVLLDAGVSLGPSRFSLPPHPKEYRALRERRTLMLKLAEKADLVTVSHYHFDHHTPSYIDWASNWSSPEIADKIYSGKTVLAKSFKSKINPSQRHRGWMFTKTISKRARLEFADGRTFQFGATMIRFSAPIFHGREGSELGWVLMTTIVHDDDILLFAPDIQGPIHEKTLELILKEWPVLAIVGGPPLYLVEFSENRKKIDLAMTNLATIAKQVPTIIIDHHLLRDMNWMKIAQPVFDTASSLDHKVLTAAEYAGEESNLLEAKRKDLYETESPSKDFIEWSNITLQERKTILPPI